MPPSSLTRAGVAPTPPAGPTTYTALTGMAVGVIIAVLSLFDVVPSGEDVQALGTITGAAIAAIAFVVSAISRTKQANNLSKLAAAERKAAPLVVAPAGATDAQMREMATRAGAVVVPSGSLVGGVKRENWSAEAQALPSNGGVVTTAQIEEAREHLPTEVEIASWTALGDAHEEVLGAPTDLSREVQFGSVRPPGVDVGGEAPVVIDSDYADLTQGPNT